MDKAKITLENLGYNKFFESNRENLGLTKYPVARIVAEYREVYRVRNIEGEFLAKVTGKHMFTAIKREDYPAVGDWVIIEELPENKAIIRGILPRKTILKRKYSNKQENQIIAANIDTAFIVESMDRDYNLNRFERFFVLAIEGNITPVMILNKIDLISKIELDNRINKIQNRFASVNIIATSTVTREGLDDLRNYIKMGETYCFLGSSGIGKSSLINRLLQKDEIKTREMSLVTGKGKHTTTTREMYFLENGGLVVDNPGTREVGIADSDMGIEGVFDEISQLSKECRYSDCTHMHELGCMVLKAVEEEKLDKDKYTNFIKLKKEAEFYKMTDVEKREKDRKFGEFVKKAKNRLKDN
ncbi:ribosome small subunit-dependent GTPase A [Candidatus Chlorohelix sp.]|uniref:ribosome small subunit-dependent GTPase A n=1 Tax=Candidatus Chlorohelix sp. TaxID=3139201 RepID=UPI0030298479